MKQTEKQFNLVLDECIDRIVLQGQTMEECLALHPEFADQLRAALETVNTVARAYSYAPSSATKEQGRQRLARALQALQQPSAEAAPSRWLRWGLAWQPRWVTALAAVLLAVAVGGAGTVAAAGSSLPGSPLYPVKRSIEAVRLTLTAEPEQKASLHLSFAQKRAQEMSDLILAGRTEELQQTETGLRQNLLVAANLTQELKDPQAALDMRSKLEDSASQALATLQRAVQGAPEGSRDAATSTFQSSSATYGSTVEQVAASAPERYVAASPGVLQVWVTDPPPPGVEKVLLKIQGIEAHRVSQSASGWVSLSQEAQTFDLLHIVELEQFLGEQPVEPGTYTKVRFDVTRVLVVAGGVEREAKVPSSHVELARPFRVEEGKTTVLVLDFDGARSLRTTGRDEYMLTPVVQVLAREPVQPEKGQAKGAGSESKKEQRNETVQKGTAGKSEGPRVRSQVTGPVETVAPGFLIVRGKRIAVTADTKFEGKVEAGQVVVVEGLALPDGSFQAVKVTIITGPEGAGQKPQTGQDKKGDGQGNDRGQKGDGGETQPPGKQGGPEAVSFSARIQALLPGRWVLDGREILITGETVIEGTPAVGLQVLVEGTQDAKGIIVATKLTVAEGRPVTPTPTPTATATATPTSSPRPTVPTPTPSARDKVQVTGTIELLGGQYWTVEGQIVKLSTDTKVEGEPSIGARVTIEGIRQGDGAILAARIKVLGALRDDEKARPTPTLTPGPAATATPTSGPKDTPTPPEGGKRVHVQGTLQSFSASRWVVDGQTVQVSLDTVIEGVPAIGATVTVEGVEQPEGQILALRLKVVPGGGQKEDTKGGTATPEPTPLPKPSATPAATRTPVALVVPTVTPMPTLTLVHIEGPLSQLLDKGWKVDGRVVLIDAQTVIEGVPIIGSRVGVTGLLQDDGTVLARVVKVLK